LEIVAEREAVQGRECRQIFAPLQCCFVSILKPMKKESMNAWFWYAVGAAVLYGLHQVFTKMASDRISDGLGGFVVEGSAALTILAYLGVLWFSGRWNQTSSAPGVWYSMLTGLCVGVGTIFFFLLFQKGGPLSAVPMILAGGAALMALAGIFFFHEKPTATRLLGVALSIVGLFLLRR
jgi:transporter family protein